MQGIDEEPFVISDTSKAREHSGSQQSFTCLGFLDQPSYLPNMAKPVSALDVDHQTTTHGALDSQSNRRHACELPFMKTVAAVDCELELHENHLQLAKYSLGTCSFRMLLAIHLSISPL